MVASRWRQEWSVEVEARRALVERRPEMVGGQVRSLSMSISCVNTHENESNGVTGRAVGWYDTRRSALGWAIVCATVSHAQPLRPRVRSRLAQRQGRGQFGHEFNRGDGGDGLELSKGRHGDSQRREYPWTVRRRVGHNGQ